MLMSIVTNSPFFVAALNFFLLFQGNNNGATTDDAARVGLTPSTVGIPVIAYLIGAALLIGAIYLLYRRAVLKKKDILSK